MQNIKIEKINERGKLLERSDANFVDVMLELYEIKDYDSKYPLLSYVDPYGLTYFNNLQKSNLIKELEKLDFDKEQKKKIIKFIKNAKDFEYIRLIGD